MNPISLSKRKRKHPYPYITTYGNHPFPVLQKKQLGVLHVAALAQIMSVRPENDLNKYIDWSNLAPDYIRLCPASGTSTSPLAFTWPRNAHSLILTDALHVHRVIEHAAAFKARGTVLVLNPTASTRGYLRPITNVRLEFKEGSKIFVDGKQPQTFDAYIIDDFEFKLNPPPREFKVHVHPAWDDKVPAPHCPLDVDEVEKILRFHPDDDFVFKNLDNLRFGVQYGCEMDRLTTNIHDPSRNFRWNIMEPIMEKEHKQGFCSAVFDFTPGFPRYDVLPLFNLHAYPTFHVTKKLGTKARKVNHLSKQPKPVNDYMELSNEEEAWHPFRTSKELVIHFGRNTLIKKNHKTAAYKTAKLKPQDYHLAGESLPKKSGQCPTTVDGVVINITTVFGGRTSYKMWRDSGGDLIEFAYYKTAAEITREASLDPEYEYAITKWVDDYHQFLSPDEQGNPRAGLAQKISQRQEQLMKAEMTGSEFNTSMEVLGHVLNTKEMRASLTERRRQYLVNMIFQWLQKEWATLNEYHELCGHLQFATEVVTAGKVHMLPLRAVIGMMSRKNLKGVNTSAAVKSVLNWWHITLTSKTFKGTTLLIRESITTETEAGTDAALAGEGFQWGDFFFHRSWPKDILKLAERSTDISMVFLEAYTTVDCVATFAEEWEGKNVTIRCDNKPWVDAHTNSKTKCPFLIALLLTITHICAAYDITLTIEHIEGKKNVDPDLLSRNLLQAFRRRNPNATKVDVKEWPITPIWP